MDKTITTAFLIIAGIVTAVAVFNALYPAIVESSQAVTSMQGRIDQRLKEQIEIIHAAPEGEVNPTRLFVWVKNIGATAIKPVDGCDLFFGPEGNFARITYGGATTPHWTYQVENDSAWNPTATVKITIDFGALASDRYFMKIVLPSGISDDYYFSVGE